MIIYGVPELWVGTEVTEQKNARSGVPSTQRLKCGSAESAAGTPASVGVQVTAVPALLIPGWTGGGRADEPDRGCWHGAKDEEVLSKQCVSVRVLQVTAPKPALSTLKAQPCKTCSSLLKDVLHMAEHDGTHPEQGLDTCAAGHDLQQKEQAREKLTRSDEWSPSFVNYSAHGGERNFTCTQGGRDFTASSDLLQQHVLNSGRKLYRDAQDGENFQGKQNDFNSAGRGGSSL
ncbi:zinc finger protein 749 [Papio anubis]|uniref:zinc finger protein 749 n=1 Tax=Papio anubis TaxID=9555 RepID=UPI0012AD3D29|nr:zinc finger protein 749 [Papio anubis]